ncbi:hypothetical protein [Tissierella praeacuta]|uniref:hypothetical protein n=1 Tax=Tissierella praeacuta TaxID=43131 RepID=UPI002FDA1B6C
MDINLDKAISLDLANFTISGNVSITDLTSSETINIKAGTITGNLTVNTPNATVNNNATVEGTINIKDVASGTWNEKANGNTIIVDAKNTITLNIGAGKTVEKLTLDTPVIVNVPADAKINVPVEIKANVTIITSKSLEATVAQGVTVTVKAKESEEGIEVTAPEGGGKVDLNPTPEVSKSNDVSISEVKIADVVAKVDTEDDAKYTATVPFGTELKEESLALTLAKGATKKVTLQNNIYTVIVTAEDGKATKTYTITVTIAEPQYATKPSESINTITNITQEQYNNLKFKIKGLDNVELSISELVSKLGEAKITFNQSAITYSENTITFGDNIIDAGTFKKIKSEPNADKTLPYKITILVAGEGDEVTQYKLALYLSSDQTKVEAAIEGPLGK